MVKPMFRFVCFDKCRGKFFILRATPSNFNIVSKEGQIPIVLNILEMQRFTLQLFLKLRLAVCP